MMSDVLKDAAGLALLLAAVMLLFVLGGVGFGLIV